MSLFHDKKHIYKVSTERFEALKKEFGDNIKWKTLTLDNGVVLQCIDFLGDTVVNEADVT